MSAPVIGWSRWTVMSEPRRETSGRRRLVVDAVCACGVRRVVKLEAIRNGRSRSCGCLKVEMLIDRSFKHGAAHDGNHTSEYKTWRSMRVRALYRRRKSYAHVTRCAGWESFAAFLADMGPRPSLSHSIDRIDNDGGYWCGHCSECVSLGRTANCRWATGIEQANNMRSNHRLEIDGDARTIAEWSRLLGVPETTICWWCKQKGEAYACARLAAKKAPQGAGAAMSGGMTTRGGLRVVPITVRAARAFADRVHAHLDPPQGSLSAAAVAKGDRVVCVALNGRPSRLLQGAAVEITRTASDGSAPHAASMCLMALVRSASELGWRRFVTYTLLGEPGTMYRAAGWHPVAVSRGGEWGRKKRPRKAAQQPGRKVRWEYGADADPCDPAVDAMVRELAGKVPLARRAPRQAELWTPAGTRTAGGDE